MIQVAIAGGVSFCTEFVAFHRDHPKKLKEFAQVVIALDCRERWLCSKKPCTGIGGKSGFKDRAKLEHALNPNVVCCEFRAAYVLWWFAASFKQFSDLCL